MESMDFRRTLCGVHENSMRTCRRVNTASLGQCIEVDLYPRKEHDGGGQ